MQQKMPVLTRLTQSLAIIATTIIGLTISGHQTVALTADDVLNKMGPKESASYVNGIVEGLATARWLKDRPNADGAQCIYDWYYQEPITPVWNRVVAWFERHPDQSPGTLMHVLIKKECGE